MARKAGRGLLLETPTWRANPDWAAKVGYDLPALDRVNQAAVEFIGVEAATYADLADGAARRRDGAARGRVRRR